MNNKQAIINGIMEQLIDVLIIDYKESGANTVDKKNIDYKYTNHQTINAVIKNTSNLCIRDWNDYTIIRDEVYASVYEVMLKISKDYTEDELILISQDIYDKTLPITNQFLVSVYKLAVFHVKFNLSGYRRCSNGLLPAKDYLEYTGEVLNNSPEYNFGLHISPNEADPSICFFIDWFNKNKETFLTKKQLQFIEDESLVNQKNHSQYKKRIYESTLRAYQEQFETDDEKTNELETQIKLVESILNSQDFSQMLIKHRDKTFILDALTTHVSMPTMRAFNKGDRSYQVIKPFRVALYKLLNELNQLLDNRKSDICEDILV